MKTYKSSKYKAQLCCSCNILKAGKPCLMQFEYHGMQVKVKKSGLECRICCMRNWITNFENNAKDVILISDEKFFVDWEKYSEKDSNEKEIINYILQEISIIDYVYRGGYAIISGTVIINPSISGSPMLFQDKLEFENYVKTIFTRVAYSWTTIKIEKVENKNQFLIRKG